MAATWRTIARTRQRLLEYLLGAGTLSVVVYAAAYLVLDRPAAMLVELSYLLLAGGSLVWVAWLRRPGLVVVWPNVIAILFVCLGNTITLGGLVPSGLFVVWGAISPASALVFLGPRAGAGVFVAYAALILLCVWLPVWDGAPPPLPPEQLGALTAANLVFAPVLLLGTLGYFLWRLVNEEGAVRSSEAKLRGILDNLPAAVMLEEPEGRLILVNRRLSEMTGRDEGASCGLTLNQVLPPDAAELLDASRVEVMAGNAVVELEVPLPVNGEPRRHQIVRFPVRAEGGGILAVCGVATEVEERRRLQDEALKAQKLDSLGTLAGGIAHDFNNILMAFAGNVAMARSLAGPDHPVEERLASAESALEQARHLTNQLLMFARGGAPVRSTASIAETVRGSATFALHGRRATCAFDIPEDLWPVDADLGQIHQLVQNLVLNADQAMPDGGAITVRCDNRMASADVPGLRPGRRYVRLSVGDRGVGIPEDEKERVFDPYYSTREGGSGLGLSSCYAIVRSHGGRIMLESEVGVGTTFSVWLPASATRESPVVAPAPEAPRIAPPVRSRVLLMDDEPDVREVLVAMLGRLGCDPVPTEDGVTALARFEAANGEGRPFDVVILDLTIKGGMGGAETARAIAARDAGVPIVASSGYANAPILANHREHGFAGVLRKPYTMKDLAAVLDKVREGAATERAAL